MKPKNNNKNNHPEKKSYKCTRISAGHYLYRGYRIVCHGYYPPDGKVVWEAVNDTEAADAHGFSRREVMKMVDYLLD